MSLSDTVTNAIGAADPTGILSAAGAAAGLVGTVLRTVPALRNATHAIQDQYGSSNGFQTLHRAQTAVSAAEVAVDPERERRAYETVNFVLRELGSRICAAGLVDEHALSRALTSAAQHIDSNLFSGDANRLFASLGPKLEDPLLVNNVFASIYFIGAMTAELSRSLPNYKESYVPLGPRIVQQLFRTAIGEDAFRQNLSSNLDAYKTLATTAGLLRPTDIGYSAFPGFPAFSPSRYSSRAYGDVRNNKIVYEKITRHLEKFGFPQPVLARQAEVGNIKEWRFISGDAPSRTVEVERADKNIGESFGRVLHWLICSADRLPPSQAIIAYYDQHIELVKWIGQRMGYCVLSSRTDLDWSGDHLQLDKRARAISDTWVILMSSEKAQATRRASSAQWTQTHMKVAGQPAPAQAHQQQSEPKPPRAAVSSQTQKGAAVPLAVPPVSPPPIPSVSSQVPASQAPTRKQSTVKTIDQRLDDAERDFNNVLLPRCNKFLNMPSTNQKARDAEYHRLTQHIERGLINWLHGLPIPENHPARDRRKAMVVHAQQALEALDRVPKPAQPESTPIEGPIPAAELTGSAPQATPLVPHPVAATWPRPGTAHPQPQPAPMVSLSPPPYSPASPASTSSSTVPLAFPFPEKSPTKPVVRRKAPPPPKRFITAKALYDFEPDADNEDELAIKEDNEIEIIENNAALGEEGWCRARIKGQKKTGLVPLEYLEIEQKGPIAAQAPAPMPAAVPQSQTSTQPPAHVSFGQGNQITVTGAPLPSPYPSAPPSTSPLPMRSKHQGPPVSTNNFGEKLEVSGSRKDAQPASVITENPTNPDVGNQANNVQSTAPSQGEQSYDTHNTDSSIEIVTPSAPDEISPPSPVMDLSAFSSPPFEPQPFASEPVSGAPIENINPYFPALNLNQARSPSFDPMMAATEIQHSAMSSDSYTPTSPFESLAVSEPLMQATAPNYYSSPIAAPTGSPILIADEQAVTDVTTFQMSTESIVDGNVEVIQTTGKAYDFDDAYDS